MFGIKELRDDVLELKTQVKTLREMLKESGSIKVYQDKTVTQRIARTMRRNVYGALYMASPPPHADISYEDVLRHIMDKLGIELVYIEGKKAQAGIQKKAEPKKSKS
jgi:hypothetical protein